MKLPQEMINLAKRATIEHTHVFPAQKQGKSNANEEQHSHNLFHALLTSNLPAEDKRAERIAHEGFEILLAGTYTTARAMEIAVYHLIANPPIIQKLKEELACVMRTAYDRVDLNILQNLPWLVGLFLQCIDSINQGH